MALYKLPGLRRVRESLLLSQQELADKATVTQPNISRWETGLAMANGRTVRRLARALGVNPQALLTDPEAETAA